MPPWVVELLAPAGTPGEPEWDAVWGVARALGERGHRVRVLFPAPGAVQAPSVDHVQAVPVPTLGGGRGEVSRAVATGKNASELLDPRADLVIGFDERSGAIGAKFAPSSGRPVFVLWPRGSALAAFDQRRKDAPGRGLRARVGEVLDRRTVRTLESRALARARRVFVRSQRDRDALRGLYPLPDPKVDLLPGGVPDPVDSGSRDAARTRLHIPHDVPVVACDARRVGADGLARCLEAYRRVRAFFPGSRLVVLGAAPAGEPGVVGLADPTPADRGGALRASDVFLFPSSRAVPDPTPLEAMRYGLAAVVSRTVVWDEPVPPEAIRVVQGEEAGDYASDLAELLADPALARRIGAAGREVADRLSFPRIAERLELRLEPLVGPAGRGS